jgi:phosphatidylinositol transfer protein SFH5
LSYRANHLSRYYPETVSYKYFVNVPLIMQWMMGAMKALMSKDSIQKMTWLTYGNQLHTYIGEDVPKEYGGIGVPLQERSTTPKYGEPETVKKEEAADVKTEPAKEATDTQAKEEFAAQETAVEPGKDSSVEKTA